MRPRPAGRARAAFSLSALALPALMLAGCLAPMGQREAEQRAARGISRYCRDHVCERMHLVGAQKIKQRWLVDYDAPQHRYGVAVDEGGNTDISVWDKGS